MHASSCRLITKSKSKFFRMKKPLTHIHVWRIIQERTGGVCAPRGVKGEGHACSLHLGGRVRERGSNSSAEIGIFIHPLSLALSPREREHMGMEHYSHPTSLICSVTPPSTTQTMSIRYPPSYSARAIHRRTARWKDFLFLYVKLRRG